MQSTRQLVCDGMLKSRDRSGSRGISRSTFDGLGLEGSGLGLEGSGLINIPAQVNACVCKKYFL